MKKTVVEIMEIASEEKKRREIKWGCNLCFYVLIDAGNFYCVGYKYKNPEDEGIIPSHNHIDIDAETGKILIAKPYRPWSEYGKKLDAGKKLEIPEEFLK